MEGLGRAWCVGFALLVGATAVGDRRSEWQVFIEDGVVPEDLLAFASDAGNVYWEGGVDFLWLKLGKASYYSCHQGTAAMFFARTAAEYRRRTDGLSVLNTADFADDGGGICDVKRTPGAQGPETREQLADACRALPELDAKVLINGVQGVPSRVWRTSVSLLAPSKEEVTTRHVAFHMSRCSDLR